MNSHKNLKLLPSSDKLKQRKSWKSLVVICIGLIIGIIADVIFIETGFAFVYVSDDYLNEIFGVTCTVAVLGNAVLALLFGSSDRKIKGIPFQDVLGFTKFGSDQRLTINSTVFSIILAIAAYSLDLCTTVTLMACVNVFLIISSSVDLWEILSKEEKQLKIVNEIIDNGESTRGVLYVENWFETMGLCLDSSHESAINEFCTLISKISETAGAKEHPVNSAIARYLPKLFELACEKLGFVDAYKLISKINSTQPDGFIDCDTTAIDYIRSLKYDNTINDRNRSVPTVIETILIETEFESWAKKSFVYSFFCAIYYNSFLSLDAKNDILVDILNILTYLRDDVVGEIKKEVLYDVVKYDVLLGNYEGRTKLFYLLTESLLRNNQYEDSNVFIATIAEVFRAFYFYVYCEKQTLTQEYRKELLILYHSKQSNKDLVELSFNYLIKEYYEEIIPWLVKDSMTFDQQKRIRWDYFSPTTKAKKMVWYWESVVRFAYCFYKLVGYTNSGNPFVEFVEADNIEDGEKIAFCRVITDLYNDGCLNDVAQEIVKQLEELTSVRIHRGSYIDKLEYEYFQDMLSELLSKNNQEVLPEDSPTEEILALVNKELEKGNIFVFDAELQMKPVIRRKLEPILIERTKHYTENSAYRIARVTKKLINDIIARNLKKVSVNFGQIGINTLLENLEGQKFEYRNYMHINDITIPSHVKLTEAFRSLCGCINEIKYDSSNEIIPRVFLKTDRVPYKIFIKYHLENPTEEECAVFVRRHQIAEGTYLISSNRFDFSHAMQYVRKNYSVENVEISLHVKINANSGFQIEFEHTKE